MTAKFVHKTITLTGSAQRLVTSFTDPAPGGADDPLCDEITIQAAPANANPAYIGGDAGVLSTDYGIFVPIPATSVPAAPIVLRGHLRPSMIWVIGTNTQKLHVTLSVI